MSTGLPDWFSRVQAEMLFLFLDLSDVPADYVGSALKGVRVNAAESGLEFASLAHTLASHTTKAHAELTDVTKDQHHAENHYTRHEAGGADEISVQGLLGVLADLQKAAGGAGYVQFNAADILAADSGLFWNNTNKRLGIGTTNPPAKLSIYGAPANFYTATIDINRIAPTNDQGISFTAGSAVNYLIGRLANSDDLVFSTWNGGTVSEKVRFTSGGNVGIGATNPKSKLDVVGLPQYANNAAAIAGGLAAGSFYRTGGDPDPVCVVH